MNRFFCILITHIIAIIQVLLLCYYIFFNPSYEHQILHLVGVVLCTYIAGLVKGL